MSDFMIKTTEDGKISGQDLMKAHKHKMLMAANLHLHSRLTYSMMQRGDEAESAQLPDFYMWKCKAGGGPSQPDASVLMYADDSSKGKLPRVPYSCFLSMLTVTSPTMICS